MIRRRRRRPPEEAASVPLTDEERVHLEQRRASANDLLGDGSPGAIRVLSAPAAYVLAHTSSDLARHSELLDPLPAPGEVRLIATPTRDADHWYVDIATRDRPGLLAAFSGVLATAGIEVAQAVLATWDDGAALQAFTVHTDAPLLDLVQLQEALTRSLSLPLSSAAIPDARVTFDAFASALYTSCEIVASDRAGLLHSLAVAIAAAGVDIHAASVATHDGFARDRFDLSDPDGGKLDRALEERIVVRLCEGTNAYEISPR